MIDENKINDYIKIIYKLSLKAYNNGDIPVGAIVINNNKIIGKGYNNRQSKHLVTGHAEIIAISKAEKKIKDWRLNDSILLTTLKPCNMCNEVIKSSRISKVYYLLDQENVNYEHNYENLHINNEIYDKYFNLLKNFFKNIR